ncbi:hypothetical protein [Pararhodobacter oceanensis]|uniref:hypothetical protein n=1 Tax=Pararhodobacter oceanensis TaxID=2172121 RepID=UPI001057D3DC|nr:hypothetical protein [Pararhodobacter oceanensis]
MDKLNGQMSVDDVTAPVGICVPRWVLEDPKRGVVISEFFTVGLNQAKNVFQAAGAVGAKASQRIQA